MYSNVMLDLETLGTRPDAAILSIGAIAFNLHNNDTAWLHVKCAPNLAMYSVDYSTFKFWMGQPDAARAPLFVDTVSLREGLYSFVAFFRLYVASDAEVWALPAAFDLPILENALRAEGGEVPWKYNAGACLRTLYKLAGITKAERVQPKVAHDALSDCEAQVATLRLAFKKLGAQVPPSYTLMPGLSDRP